MVASGEMLIELGDSWLIAKVVLATGLSIPLSGIAPSQWSGPQNR